MEYREVVAEVAGFQARYDQAYAGHVEALANLKAHEDKLRRAGDFATADTVRLNIMELCELERSAREYLAQVYWLRDHFPGQNKK